MNYPIVIETGSETQAFGVIVPDLPGCFSAGDTFDEAVSGAAEAITLWIEDAIENGQNVPRPSSLDELRAGSGWRGPEWVWGFAAINPALFDDSAEQINITLPRRILARLDRRAKEENKTRSGMIARLALTA
ncbi:type II toxin-antitoxin system HicB family antitoxin [Asaia spathodeae]|uniref:Type II toxin-antitoxin system HicB family antitoxin n=1 Tax=Asaia spathodeae TaxID=657016 RepID=A0ABX2P0H7_9PROT|nr:type II toxin-antitoxin system HicB family antitoxin [Asaia spathodeae]GBR14685.1 CopG family DNA-binding protein [Asaia spathodeae NBRC 105894]